MIEHRLSRLLFALVADKLDLFSAERRLEKEKCSFCCVVYNKSMYVMGLKDSNASRQLSPTVHLPFYFNFRSFDPSLLHACFRGVLNYAMLLGKVEIISRVEPFDRVITFLEVIDRSAWFRLTARRFSLTPTICLYFVFARFCCCSFVRYDLRF